VAGHPTSSGSRHALTAACRPHRALTVWRYDAPPRSTRTAWRRRSAYVRRARPISMRPRSSSPAAARRSAPPTPSVSTRTTPTNSGRAKPTMSATRARTAAQRPAETGARPVPVVPGTVPRASAVPRREAVVSGVFLRSMPSLSSSYVLLSPPITTRMPRTVVSLQRYHARAAHARPYPRSRAGDIAPADQRASHRRRSHTSRTPSVPTCRRPSFSSTRRDARLSRRQQATTRATPGCRSAQSSTAPTASVA